MMTDIIMRHFPAAGVGSVATVVASGPVLVTFLYEYLLTVILASDPPAMDEGLRVSLSWRQKTGLKTAESSVHIFVGVELGEATMIA